ncbi:hypothetical protein BDP27DRAFT_1335529 [Rhodocollybia butyracea]|uniref:Uncharacterized protein n=1 Tax=Rhodocollybia butyracea TaxID=206335 RepID=A0A9P5U306_9AGAR|nr:hypothetical protein BDP27DRAFT_1335529 [Rhodocollybia butyracea]
MNQRTTRPPPAQYKVKNKNPLPKGHFSVLLHESKRYIGQSRYLNEEQNISRHEASICFYPENQVDEEERQVIGKIEYTLINRSRIYNAKDGDTIDNFWMSRDAISQELERMCSTLFNEDGDVRNPALEEYIGTGDIVYLDSIELDVKWRGYGIGLLALDGLIGMLPSFEMDSIIVHPAGLTSEAHRNQLKATGIPPAVEFAATQAKLIAYYRLLGMVEWTPRNADYKLLGMWTGLRLPRIEQIVPHLF